MSKVSFFAAQTLAFWAKNCEISHVAKNVFMKSSVVLNCSGKYTRQDKSESAEDIVLVAALGKTAAKISVDPRYIKASFSYKGGFKIKVDEICPKTNPQRL